MEFLIVSNKNLNLPNEPELHNFSLRLISADELYNIVRDMRTAYSPLRRFSIPMDTFVSSDFQNRNLSVVVFGKREVENETTQNHTQTRSLSQRITSDILSQFSDFVSEHSSSRNTRTQEELLGDYVPLFTITALRHSVIFTELRFCAIKHDAQTDAKKQAVTEAFSKGLYTLIKGNNVNTPFVYYVLESDDPAKELFEFVFPNKFGQSFPSTAREGITLQVLGGTKQEVEEKLRLLMSGERIIFQEQEETIPQEFEVELEIVEELPTRTRRSRRRR